MVVVQTAKSGRYHSAAHLEMESEPPLKPLSISQSQKTIHEPKMYTKGSTTPQVAVVSTSAQPSTTTEPLTYWTDARSSTMARPSPSVSNCGLVIVQVQDNNRTTGQFVEENRTFYHHEPQSLTNWSNITLDNRIFLSDSTNMSVTQSPVIEGPTTAQIVEVEETIEDEDEGYRTSPGADTSPVSNASPPPPSKVLAAKKTTVQPSPQQAARPQTRNGMRRVATNGEGGPEESNNLMWLLDFKLDFFNEGQDGIHGQMMPHPNMNMLRADRNSHVMNLNNEGEKHVSISAANAATVLSPVGTPTPSTVTPPVAAETAGAVIETNVNEVTIPSSSNQTQNDNEPSSQIIQEDSNKEYERKYRKPPYTYTELITQALKDQKALTVSGIYNWITDRFPYFKAEDERWKNSVRHNLSMNPHFRKGNKAKHGSGHLWVLADIEEADQQVVNATSSVPQIPKISAGTAQEVHHEDHEDEAAKAVRSILGHNDFEVQSEKLRIAHQQQQQSGQPRNEGSEANNNKDLSTEMKRTSSRLRELVSPTSSSQPNNNHRGLKRPSNAVEIQYVTAAAVSESKLDAPDVFVTTDIHNAACIPPSAKRPNNSSNSSLQQPQQQPPPQPLPFSPMDQMEELDVVAAYCGSYPTGTSASVVASVAASAASAVTAAANSSQAVEVESLEKALGIEFHDPNVVQRQLLAK